MVGRTITCWLTALWGGVLWYPRTDPSGDPSRFFCQPGSIRIFMKMFNQGRFLVWVALIALSEPVHGLQPIVRTHGPAWRVQKTSQMSRRASHTLQMVSVAPFVWAAGTVLGGTAGTPSVVGAVRTWYRRIPLPSWTPPDRVFAPVWTTLYAMIGIATARVARASGTSSPAVLHFIAHYAVNVAWAPVFFGLQRLRVALAMNLALVCSLTILIVQYAAVAPTAAWLLAPYMLWLLFATQLNIAICRLNPTVRGYNNARCQAELMGLQRAAFRLAFATR